MPAKAGIQPGAEGSKRANIGFPRPGNDERQVEFPIEIR